VLRNFYEEKNQQLKFNYYFFFKSMLLQPDVCELSRQRSYSSPSNQSDSSLEASSKTTIPLKKRLLDAYNNEQHPTSSL
jgi:hypothetical protein